MQTESLDDKVVMALLGKHIQDLQNAVLDSTDGLFSGKLSTGRIELMRHYCDTLENALALKELLGAELLREGSKPTEPAKAEEDPITPAPEAPAKVASPRQVGETAQAILRMMNDPKNPMLEVPEGLLGTLYQPVTRIRTTVKGGEALRHNTFARHAEALRAKGVDMRWYKNRVGGYSVAVREDHVPSMLVALALISKSALREDPTLAIKIQADQWRLPASAMRAG